MSVGTGAADAVPPSAEPTRFAIPGARIERVYRPADVASLQAVVAAHHATGGGLLLCGGQTRLEEANPARGIVAALSLAALAGVDVFEPDEGVVHALAGTPIRVLREIVAAEGWELPLDPPGETATVGGTLASAAVGPRAHAFGRVADAVLGLEVVDGAGVASKCGGRVVKNVTGYDLAKLYVGSHGSLAVLTGAWLRLRPQPARRLVLTGRVAGDSATFERVRGFARATSVRSFVWSEGVGSGSSADSGSGSSSLSSSGEAMLCVELAAGEAAVAHDRDLLRSALGLVETAEGAEALAVVDGIRDGRVRARSDAALGLWSRVLPTRLDTMRTALLAAGFELSIDLGLAAITARLGGAPGAPVVGLSDGCGSVAPSRDAGGDGEGGRGGAAGLVALRTRAEACGGVLRFEWLPSDLIGALDVFGEEAGTRALVESLVQRFDPRGILNPGRFVAGT